MTVEAMSELELLRGARQAVSEGLISAQDYDVVKVAFLRAQQIKAGLDAGFIRREDYDKARDTFLSSLDVNAIASGSSGGVRPAAPFRTSRSRSWEAPPGGSNNTAGGWAAPPSPGVVGGNKVTAIISTFGGGSTGASPRGSLPSPGSGTPGSGIPPTGLQGPRSRLPISAFSAFQTSGSQSGAATPVNDGVRSSSIGRGSSYGGAADNVQRPGRPSAVQQTAAISAPEHPVPTDFPQYSKGATAGKVSMAGIAINEDCVNIFMHLKSRSAYKWITFKVDDSGKMVIPEKVGAKTSNYQEFVAALPSNECRYGVFDYEYTSAERGSFSKIVFINWAPESAHIKTKMMYAATKDFFKGFMEGTGAEIQASELSEVSEEEIEAKVVANLSRK